VGHYGPDVIPNKIYSDAEIQNLFSQDKKRFEADVNKVWTSDMPKGAFGALFSLAYNHGNVSKTAVGKAAKAGTWKDREKFSKIWLSSYTCKGLLTKRR
jgi:GH24 family phage-related lysozyme (muramidase)